MSSNKNCKQHVFLFKTRTDQQISFTSRHEQESNESFEKFIKNKARRRVWIKRKRLKVREQPTNKWRIHKILLWSFKPLFLLCIQLPDFLMLYSLFSQADVHIIKKYINFNAWETLWWWSIFFFYFVEWENRHKRALKMMPPRGKMKNLFHFFFHS